QPSEVRGRCVFVTVTVSRFDLHIDWQGGYTPTFAAGEVVRFIKPRQVKWHPYLEGTRCAGYRFDCGGAIFTPVLSMATCCTCHAFSQSPWREQACSDGAKTVHLAMQCPIWISKQDTGDDALVVHTQPAAARLHDSHDEPSLQMGTPAFARG